MGKQNAEEQYHVNLMTKEEWECQSSVYDATDQLSGKAEWRMEGTP